MRVLRECIPIFMLLAAPGAAAVRGERRRLQVITREQCQGEELEFVSQGCSTAEACEAAALEMGLELGSDEWDFAGNYADKGCIYYPANHPEYPNQAYFGEGWGHCGELRTIPMANGIRINCNGGEGTTTTTTTEIFDPMLCQGEGLCRTMQDCRRAAQLQGYQLGSELEPFAGEYYVKGCVFYPDDHPEYPGQSYWGAGASFCGQLRADPFEYDGSQRLSCDGVGPPQEMPQPDDELLGSTGGGGGGGSQSQGQNTGGQQQQGGGGSQQQGQNTGGQQQGGGGGSQSQGQNTGGQQQQGSTGGGGTEAQNQGQNTGGQQQTGTGGFGSTEDQGQQMGGQQQQTGTGGFGSTDNQGQQTGGGQQQQTEGGGGGQSQQEVNQQEPRPNAEDAQQGQITGGEPQQQLETGTTGGGQGQTTGQAQQGQAGAGTQEGQGAGGTAPVERPAEAPGQSPLGPQATADGKKEDDDGDEEEDKKQDDEKEEDQKEDEKEDTKDDGDDNDLDQFTVSAIEGQQATSDGNAPGGRMQMMLQAAALAVMWFSV